jgi:Heterokaryon incompatibility protein (HET)
MFTQQVQRDPGISPSIGMSVVRQAIPTAAPNTRGGGSQHVSLMLEMGQATRKSDFAAQTTSLQALTHKSEPLLGVKPCIRLTSETLCAFEKDIPVSELSNTFRDTITITRRLGVRHLWIDSLCII